MQLFNTKSHASIRQIIIYNIYLLSVSAAREGKGKVAGWKEGAARR
jgi:hypothetical protein